MLVTGSWVAANMHTDEVISAELEAENAAEQANFDYLLSSNTTALPRKESEDVWSGMSSGGEALEFEFADAEARIDISADVALSLAEMRRYGISLPENLDISVRVVYVGQLTRPPDTDAWTHHSKITVAAALSFESDVVSLTLRAVGSTTCSGPQEPLWGLEGTLGITTANFEAELAASGWYNCSSRHLDAEVSIHELKIESGKARFTIPEVKANVSADFPEPPAAALGESREERLEYHLNAPHLGMGDTTPTWDAHMLGSFELSVGDAGLPNLPGANGTFYLHMASDGENPPVVEAISISVDARIRFGPAQLVIDANFEYPCEGFILSTAHLTFVDMTSGLAVEGGNVTEKLVDVDPGYVYVEVLLACSAPMDASDDADSLPKEGDLILKASGIAARLNVGGKFIIHEAWFMFNRTVAELGSIRSQIELNGSVTIGSSLHITFLVYRMSQRVGVSNSGSEKLELETSANLKYESDSLTLDATGTYATGACPSSGIQASFRGEITFAVITPVSDGSDEAPDKAELMLYAEMLCAEQNHTHEALNIIATGRNIKLAGGAFDLQFMRIEAYVALPRTELATLVVHGNVTANLKVGTLPGMALSLEGRVNLDAIIDYTVRNGLKLKQMKLDARVSMSWEQKVKISGEALIMLPCSHGISQTLTLEADFNFLPAFAAHGLIVKGRYNCGVSGNSSAALELTGAFTHPVIIGSAEITGVMLDLAVYHLEDGTDGYVGALEGKISFKAGEHRAVAANLGRPELAEHFRTHATIGASLAASDDDASDRSRLTVGAGFVFNTIERTWSVAAVVTFANSVASGTLTAALVGGKCGSNSSNIKPGSLSGSIEIIVPSLSKMYLSISGWTKCSVNSDLDPLMHASATLSELRISSDDSFEIVIKRVIISLDGYAPSPEGGELTSANDFSKLSYRAKLSGRVDISKSTGVLPIGGQNAAIAEEDPYDDKTKVDIDGSASLTLFWGAETATSASTEVDVNVSFTSKNFALRANAHFEFPCRYGSSISVSAVFDLYLEGVDLKNGGAKAAFICEAPEGEGFVTFEASISSIKLEAVEIENVKFNAELFKDKSDKGKHMRGSISGTLKAASGSAAVSSSFQFDTLTGTIRAAVAVHFEVGALKGTIIVAKSVIGDCDLVRGDRFTGTAVFAVEGKIELTAAISGVRHCGYRHFLHAEEISTKPTPTAPVYNPIYAAMRRPPELGTSSACASLTNRCGPQNGNRVCAGGKVCSEKGTCQSLFWHGNSNKGMKPYSNNFGGACSKCSFDKKCGAGNGGTVCPGGEECSDGICVKAAPTTPAFTSPLHPNRIYSNNYAHACGPPPRCADDGKCGLRAGGQVCPIGEQCVYSFPFGWPGECRKGAVGDPDFSDGRGGACGTADQSLCAIDRRCGPAAGKRVCPFGEKCVSSSIEGEAGYCVGSWLGEAYDPSKYLQEYSDNHGGACVQCASGKGGACGVKSGLVCPGTLACAKVYRPPVQLNQSSGSGTQDFQVTPVGVLKGEHGPIGGEARWECVEGDSSGVDSMPSSMPNCTSEQEAEGPCYKETVPQDYIEWADKKWCDRPDLVSVPVPQKRTIDSVTWSEISEEEILDNEDVGRYVTYTSFTEPCGPRKGGLVCSHPEMVCAVREGRCVPSVDTRVTRLAEYSANYGNFGSRDGAAIKSMKDRAERDNKLAGGVNLGDLKYRDHPAVVLRLSVKNASFAGGKITAKNVVLTAQGTILTSDEEDKPDMESLYWDGEVSGELQLAPFPGFSASLSIAAAWTYNPTPGDNERFNLRPILSRGEIRTAFGGSPLAPTCALRALTTFAVPCEKGYRAEANGVIELNKLGGVLSGTLAASATLFCGVEKMGDTVALIFVSTSKPIIISDFLKIGKLDVQMKLTRAGEDALAAIGSINGEAETLGQMDGLVVGGVMIFDTAADEYLAQAEVSYVKEGLIDLKLQTEFAIGRCRPTGFEMSGWATITAAPVLSSFVAQTSVIRHCEGAEEATRLHGRAESKTVDLLEKQLAMMKMRSCEKFSIACAF